MNNSLKTLHSSPAYLYHEPAKPKLLYPSLVIAAVAVTLFSLLGIATMTGILPQAHSASSMDGGAARQEAVATEQASVAQGTESTVSNPRTASGAVATCHVCGSVESINQIESKGQGSGIGAVAGGIAGALLGNTIGAGNGRTAMTLLGAGGGAYAGNEIEKNTHKSTSYRIRVRLENGELRTVYQRTPPAVAVGDRVKVVNGEIVRLS
jgi:outer membrane lipoprotein SlyB